MPLVDAVLLCCSASNQTYPPEFISQACLPACQIQVTALETTYVQIALRRPSCGMPCIRTVVKHVHQRIR